MALGYQTDLEASFWASCVFTMCWLGLISTGHPYIWLALQDAQHQKQCSAELTGVPKGTLQQETTPPVNPSESPGSTLFQEAP